MKEAVLGSLNVKIKVLILKGRKSQEKANSIISKRLQYIAQKTMAEDKCLYTTTGEQMKIHIGKENLLSWKLYCEF